MKKWMHETYWTCRFFSAYYRLERAHKALVVCAPCGAHQQRRLKRAKLDVVLSLTYLGKYDFQVAEFARYVRMKFAEEEHDGCGWV